MDEWIEHVATYLMWMTASGARPGTVRLRRSYLMRLAVFVEVGPWRVQPGQLLAFMGTFAEKSPETRRSARTAAFNFYKWSVEEELITRSPARRLPTVRVPRGSKRRGTPDAVLAAALAGATPRERLMIKLGYCGGLRRGEIAIVYGSDLDDNNILHVTGKGGNSRIVPIVDVELLEALRWADDGPLFPGKQDGHIGPDWVGKLLSKRLGPGWAGHTLRHRCGTRALRGTKNLRVVQELLGHAQVTTTQLYTEVDEDELFEAVRAAA